MLYEDDLLKLLKEYQHKLTAQELTDKILELYNDNVYKPPALQDATPNICRRLYEKAHKNDT
jgi:hypothetical protein